GGCAAPGAGAAAHAEAAPTARSSRALEQRRQRRGRIFAGDDRHDLELHQIRPLHDPALQQRDVIALHQLKAAAHVRLHPAADERQPVRHLAAAVAQPTIDRLAVLIAERLDDHEEHGLAIPFICSPRTVGPYADSPRLRLRLALRPHDVLRLALQQRDGARPAPRSAADLHPEARDREAARWPPFEIVPPLEVAVTDLAPPLT